MIELQSTKSEPKLVIIDTNKQKHTPITTNSQAILTPSQFALLYKNDVILLFFYFLSFFFLFYIDFIG